jgi:nucleoside-diphosphate-sugar epimerase
MRNATAYGMSPRMRFAIVVNSLTALAKTTKKIQILGDGTPWRPLVHVKDICRAFIAVIDADTEIIHNHAFNVGNNSENFQIKTIAEKIQKTFSNCEITIAQKKSLDTRDYKVSFDKLNNQLDFKTTYRVEDGIKEIHSEYNRINLDEEKFTHRLYTRLKQIKYLIDNDLVDEKLKWK